MTQRDSRRDYFFHYTRHTHATLLLRKERPLNLVKGLSLCLENGRGEWIYFLSCRLAEEYEQVAEKRKLNFKRDFMDPETLNQKELNAENIDEWGHITLGDFVKEYGDIHTPWDWVSSYDSSAHVFVDDVI